MDALSFPEGLAIACGLVQAFVAAVFLRFRGMRPAWGLGWLSATYALAALLNIASPVLMDAQMGPSQAPFTLAARGLTVLIGVSVMGALVAGMRLYTGAAWPGPWAAFVLTWALFVVVITLGLSQPMARQALIGNALTALIFFSLAWRGFRASRREPGAGHGLAAGMLLLYGPMVGGAWWLGMDQFTLRYWASVPFALAGLGIMSATLGRLRAELRDLNASLEHRVAERTRDLTDMLESLESFNSMVSHDLRGSLGGISGLSSVALKALQEGRVDKAERLLTSIERESGHLAQLVSDMLMLAKATQAEVRKQHVPLAMLVDEARHTLELAHGEGHTRGIVHGELPMVLADPLLMRQVLVNLLGNALKFSREAAQPTVWVSAQPDGGGTVVRVRDNGEGFDAARSAQLFTPFARLHDAARFEGSGIGLTIVRRIVERHGGRVWADSQPGEGATFAFWLPG